MSLFNTSTIPVNLTYNNVDSRVFYSGIYVENTGMLNNLTISNSTFDNAVNLGFNGQCTGARLSNPDGTLIPCR